MTNPLTVLRQLEVTAEKILGGSPIELDGDGPAQRHAVRLLARACDSTSSSTSSASSRSSQPLKVFGDGSVARSCTSVIARARSFTSSRTRTRRATYSVASENLRGVDLVRPSGR